MAIKTTDSKGRVALGARFANKTVIVEEIDATEVRITTAAVIPEREMWLYRNKEALASVERGLEQARRGEFAKNPPDLDADRDLAERCGE